MTWELRKIGSSGRLCLLLVLAVLCNGVLFALHAAGDADGYTVSALRQPYFRRTCRDTRSACGRSWSRPHTPARAANTTPCAVSFPLRTRLARVRQAEEYPSFRAGLAAESRLKLRMSLFEGFAARSLERGAAVYESLADVIPRAAFLGGPEVLLSFHLTDALALLFPLAAGLTLLTHERAAGLVNLTRPTRLGRSRVYGRKLAAAATLSTAGFVLLYGVNALIAGLLYGFAELDAPVQSLYGFAACPYRMTVGELLALAAGLKYLWLLCCTALIFLLCARAANAAAAVGGAAVCGGHSRPDGGQLPIMAAESQSVAAGGRASPVPGGGVSEPAGQSLGSGAAWRDIPGGSCRDRRNRRRGAVCPNPRRFRQAGGLYTVASPPPAYLPGGTRTVQGADLPVRAVDPFSIFCRHRPAVRSIHPGAQ